MPKTPYMTQKHFEVLADELAHDKFYYDSLIAYYEKLDRMIKYCQTYNALDLKMRNSITAV
jgi:hypothetical protein